MVRTSRTSRRWRGCSTCGSRRETPGEARPVTHDKHRGIHQYFWAYTNRHILYLKDNNGDENWHIHRVDVGTGEDVDLTPIDGARANVVEVSHKFPAEIVIGINNRDPQWHDLHKLDVLTGKMELLVLNDSFMGIIVDGNYRPRVAYRPTAGGGMEMCLPARDGQWAAAETIAPEDALTTTVAGFDASGEVTFLIDSRGRNTSALSEWRMSTGEKSLLAENERCDVQGFMFHPRDRHVQAVAFVHQRKRWQFLDESIRQDMDYLASVCDGEIEIISRTLDDNWWIACYQVDDGPVRYYLYDRRQRSAVFLFTNRKELEGKPLAKMRSFLARSRDGLELVGYYTLPPGSDADGDGIPDRPLPTVFMPHGGPWWRDSWGYSPYHQWLANRGYAVLCVNFRASTGLGKQFLNAGNRQWGGAIQRDQVNAVKWAVARGIADPARVAIFGGSFGGYSVLAGLTFTPELFACGVDLVGPSDLTTFIDRIPPYWKPMIELLIDRVGDPRTPEGLAALKEQSPLHYVQRICRPLLIGQGKNDPRVKEAESDQIVRAMQQRNISVTYLLYPDEGHGFARPENNLSFNAVAEAFLARCLGGQAEPFGGDLAGAEHAGRHRRRTRRGIERGDGGGPTLLEPIQNEPRRARRARR